MTCTINGIPMANDGPHRREFLSGQQIETTAVSFSIPLTSGESMTAPPSGDTLRLSARAMACEFSVIMNAGEHDHIWSASEALDMVQQLETQLTVYRENSEVTKINSMAARAAMPVEPRLFLLLQLACNLSEATSGAFDLTTDPLIRLWRQCRDEACVPDNDEIQSCLRDVGMQHIQLDDTAKTVKFACKDTTINLGAIGKGYALDRACELLHDRGLRDVLLHGGRSSVLSRGDHNRCGGWPVGIGNPLFTNKRLGTIVLRDEAISTSGSNIQYFRVQGQRFGHILDPRTGRPADGTLSVTAIAPSAAQADALSTAFYVMGAERTREYCLQHSEIGAIVVPLPTSDRRVEPLVYGIDVQRIYWDSSQVK